MTNNEIKEVLRFASIDLIADEIEQRVLLPEDVTRLRDALDRARQVKTYHGTYT